MSFKSNGGFDTEDLDIDFSEDAISDEDVYEEYDDNMPDYHVASAMNMIVERTATKIPVSTSENEAVNFPSFFEYGSVKDSNIFEADALVLALPDKEGRVEFDLDNEDPLAVADKVKEMYQSSQVKAEICSYVDNERFEDINFDDLATLVDTPVEDKKAYLLDIIEKLIRNQNLKSKKEFLEKLYKLRPTRVLIGEALLAEAAIDKSREFKTRVKELIRDWENSVKEKIHSDFLRYKSVCDMRSAENNEINDLRAANNSLKSKYDLEMEELGDKLDEYKKLHRDLVSKVAELVDDEDDDKTPDEILSLIAERLEQGAGESQADTAMLEKEIESLKEEIEMLHESGSEIEAKLEDAIKENKNLNTMVEDLKIENETLRSELLDRNKREPVAAVEAENPIEEEEEDKKSSKTKNMIIAAASIVGAAIALFAFLAWFLGDEAPAPKKANYAAPAAVEKPVAAEPAPVPMAQAQVTPPVVEAAVASANYNYEAKLSEAEFAAQKFDIYIADLNKIRINGRDFAANDVINSYRFIKATTTGKILFIKENKEPFWVEMKQ